MNRLTNYLESSKLAKLHLHSALEANERGNAKQAIKMLCAAFSYQITANNNLASIAFNHRPKKGK